MVALTGLVASPDGSALISVVGGAASTKDDRSNV
jgi:hypothetical protein